jgi:endoglucanase
MSRRALRLTALVPPLALVSPLALVAVLALTAGCVPKSPTGAAGPSGAAGGKAVARPLQIAFAAPPDHVARPILKLRRGINLGNGFDAPSIGAWGVVLEEKHFDMAAAAGLDHVRLPVRFNAHALAQAPYTIDEAFFKRIDWAIDQALGRGLSIIVDLHHYEELMEDPDGHADRAVELWRQIAHRYADRPESVVFELLNEPCKKLGPERLNALYARLLPIVRAENPTRAVLVDSFFWAAAKDLELLRLPEDANLHVSFHMYQPILFTHQGAPWMDPEFQTTGVVFPGPGDVPVTPVAAAERSWAGDWLSAYNRLPAGQNPSGPAAVAHEFEMATAFAKATGRGVYLGEFGAIDFAEPVSRENYLRLVRLEAERRGFAWAVWDDGGRNQAMDVKQGRWVEPVARALFTDQPGEPLPDLTGATLARTTKSPL